METNDADIYNAIAKPMVDAAVNAYNGTIIAYGQTTSGKTYTMIGTTDEPGIIPLAVQDLFDVIGRNTTRDFTLRVSYLENYKTKIIDLLKTGATDVAIMEDAAKNVHVPCVKVDVKSPTHAMRVLNAGTKKKKIFSTMMNKTSSRSHTIFGITIQSVSLEEDQPVQISQLNFVDLAGSERPGQMGATGDRFDEGKYINKSLSTLGSVIRQLSESQEYTNFRDSKLTRLLKPSLGGNAMTTLICTVTPTAVTETQLTLDFASRFQIQIHPKLCPTKPKGVGK